MCIGHQIIIRMKLFLKRSLEKLNDLSGKYITILRVFFPVNIDIILPLNYE